MRASAETKVIWCMWCACECRKERDPGGSWFPRSTCCHEMVTTIRPVEWPRGWTLHLTEAQRRRAGLTPLTDPARQLPGAESSAGRQPAVADVAAPGSTSPDFELACFVAESLFGVAGYETPEALMQAVETIARERIAHPDPFEGLV